MIGRISLLFITLFPQHMFADENALVSLGRVNMERTRVVLNCVNDVHPLLNLEGIQIFDIVSRSPRSISVRGSEVSKESILAWTILFEYSDDQLFAFDDRSLVVSESEPLDGEVVLPDFETNVPNKVHEALSLCGVEWMGEWDLPTEQSGAFPGSVGFDLLPPSE